MQELVVVALGGNALIPDPQHQTVADQYAACKDACRHIVQLLQEQVQLVVTHGNGPQVGFIARRSEIARSELHPVPLNLCVADTQGAIGVMLQRAIYNITHQWEESPMVATIVTQVLVDADDPAFAHPAKPIGSFLDEATAKQRVEEEGWQVVEDAGRGFRRVVPSPRPIDIIEIRSIETLARAGCIVIAAGGGGIPVVHHDGGFLRGVEAVVDKDLSSSLLARKLGATKLIIATNVDQVQLHYNTPQQTPLGTITTQEARQYITEGHFAEGSMLPKVQAAIEFVEATGQTAIITSIDAILDAYHGHTGTYVVPAEPA